jgi:hypothetical protein
MGTDMAAVQSLFLRVVVARLLDENADGRITRSELYNLQVGLCGSMCDCWHSLRMPSWLPGAGTRDRMGYGCYTCLMSEV